MSFEDTVQTRLASRSNEPPETDLDYYARPENYTGSNMLAMQRVALAWQKQSSSSDIDQDERAGHNKAVNKILDKYSGVGDTTSRSSSSSWDVADLRRGSAPEIRKGSLVLDGRDSSGRWSRRASAKLDANSLSAFTDDHDGMDRRGNSRVSAFTRSSRSLSGATFSRDPRYVSTFLFFHF